VLAALAREQVEELGLQLPPEGMPGIVRYELQYDGQTLHFASYLFRHRAGNAPLLSPQDPTEAIADFCWVKPRDLPAVAESLRASSQGWHNWGAFRAVAHDLLVECNML
jgi:8-oxo-dGTP pyrophosphatase MutT (NUDIX family)